MHFLSDLYAAIPESGPQQTSAMLLMPAGPLAGFLSFNFSVFLTIGFQLSIFFVVF